MLKKITKFQVKSGNVHPNKDSVMVLKNLGDLKLTLCINPDDFC